MKTTKDIYSAITLIMFAVLFYCSPANAQIFQWAKSMGGPNGEFPRSVGLDSLGNVYTMGFFLGTADFDPGTGTFNLTSAGNTDIFISKLDASGSFVWAVKMGGDSAETGYSIEVDAVGNIYATGSFKDTVDFDPGSGTYDLISAGQDIFITKIDASGSFVWAKSMKGTSNTVAEGNSIAIDASGNIYSTGYFKDSVDFDPGTDTFNLIGVNNDVFVSKLDASGNFVWAKKMGGTATEKGVSIKVDASGNVYTTGIFQTVADFDPGTGTSNLTSIGQFDIFISKLDASGNFVWAKSFGGTNSDYGNVLSIDASGNIYSSGQYFGTIDFDPGSGTYNLTSAGTWDIYINKLDVSGNFVWAKSMGGSLGDEGFGLFVDASGYIYAAGKYKDSADFDPGTGIYNLISLGDYDICISKYDALGNLVWAVSMGDTIVDYAYSIIMDASGNIYTTGTFDGTVDFDPGSGTSNLTSVGQGDIFVHKMSQVTTNVVLTENTFPYQIKVYPNPANQNALIEFHNPINENCTLTLYDTDGRLVRTINDITRNKVIIETKDLTSGFYFLRLLTDRQVIGTGKFVITD